jgi:hypothetical protein
MRFLSRLAGLFDGASVTWRMMAIGTSLLLCLGIAAPKTAAQVPEAWRVVTSQACAQGADFPGPFEVFIFRDKHFTGECASLQPGLYPHSWTLGLPNNSISSIQVGANVRARLFKEEVYRGQHEPLTLSGNTAISDLKTFNNKISSMRVEIDNRDPECKSGDLNLGEIALFTRPSFKGDCIVLPVFGDDGQPNEFPSAESLGIAHDEISSIDTTASPCGLEAQGAFFRNFKFTFEKQSIFPTLPGHNISSIRAVDCDPQVAQLQKIFQVDTSPTLRASLANTAFLCASQEFNTTAQQPRTTAEPSANAILGGNGRVAFTTRVIQALCRGGGDPATFCEPGGPTAWCMCKPAIEKCDDFLARCAEIGASSYTCFGGRCQCENSSPPSSCPCR